MDHYEVWEEVSVWSYIGLAFMGLTSIGMVCCVIWMFTW